MKRWIAVALMAILVLGTAVTAWAGRNSDYNIGVFKAKTIQGKTVDQDSLADQKLTVLHVWATYSRNSAESLAMMQELEQAYKRKDVKVIGLVADAYQVEGEDLVPDKDAVTEAKRIAREQAAEYPQMIPTMDLYLNLLRYINTVPTVLFLDSEGNQVGYAYSGQRDFDEWTEIIDEMLTMVPGEL